MKKKEGDKLHQADSVLGRFSMYVHGSAASRLKFKERLYCRELVNRMLSAVDNESFRKALNTLNLFLNREDDDSFSLTTLVDFVERYGDRIREDYLEEFCRILEEHGFDPVTLRPRDLDSISPSWKEEPSQPEGGDEVWQKAADAYNKMITDEGVPKITAEVIKEYRDKMSLADDRTVIVSFDDVFVKKQKEQRSEGFIKKGSRVSVSDVHIQYGRNKVVFPARNMDEAMMFFICFMLANNLFENTRILFIVDGANEIKASIEKYLSWRPYTIHLDWYHLAKKCRERISSGISGDIDTKKTYVKNMLSYLWVGNLEGAVKHLDSLPVRNKIQVDLLKDYLERKKESIYCYAVRDYLHLRNSSNAVEMTNMELVAARMKNNGMSWSKQGSHSLALIKAMYWNGFAKQWIKDGTVNMGFALKQVA